MKNISLLSGLLIFMAIPHAFATMGRELSYAEQKVVADQLAQVIPSMLQGDDGTLTDCNLTNVAPMGHRSKLEVSCVYTSAVNYKAYAIFDKIKLDQSMSVVEAKFKSLNRQ